MQKKAIAELLCGHNVWVRYSGTAGVMRDREDCPVHGKGQLVNEYHREQWHSKCTVCRFGRSHGFSRRNADMSASRHSVQTGHKVNVLWYNKLPPDLSEPVNKPDEEKPTLFDIPLDPPF